VSIDQECHMIRTIKSVNLTGWSWFAQHRIADSVAYVTSF